MPDEHDPAPDENLDDVYDAETLSRLDAWEPSNDGDEQNEAEPAMSRLARWSRETAFGAALRGSALGLAEVLDPDPDAPVIVEVDANGQLDDRPVRLYFVPGAPELTVAVVRPWLFDEH